LNIDEDLGLLEFLLETGHLRLQLLVLLGQGVAGRLAAPLVRQGAEGAGGAEPPPLDQMGRVQTFAPQQRADLTRIGGAVSLFHDGELVLGGELAALGLGHNLGVGGGRRRPPRVGSPCATGGLAPLAHPPLRGCQLDHAGISIQLQSAYHDVSSSPPPESQ